MNSRSHSEEQPALDESLTDAEYDRLQVILRHFPDPVAMNLEEMDGFFTALICAPVTIAPGECLEEIWGGDTAPFADLDDFEEFFGLAMRHWNSIVREFASPGMTFIPWLDAEEGEELPRGNRWARGFLRGVNACPEGWDEIYADEQKFAMLLCILALAHENDPDPEMRTWKTPPGPELRERLLAGLSVSAQRVYDYFRPHRIREARRGRTGVERTGAKIGRNDPCYCGSGKKYKHCCGNVIVN